MVVFEEESVDLASQEGEVDGFFEDGKGVESERFGEKSFLGALGQEDAG